MFHRYPTDLSAEMNRLGHPETSGILFARLITKSRTQETKNASKILPYLNLLLVSAYRSPFSKI